MQSYLVRDGLKPFDLLKIMIACCCMQKGCLMPSLPYMPLYPKDILTDDRMSSLKSEEQGLFILLLCRLWINENEIRDNDHRISRILNISTKKWSDLKAKLLNLGLLNKDDFMGYLRNNRLTKELKLSKEKSDNGAKAARIKWDKINAAKSKTSYRSNSSFDGFPE